VDAPHKFNFVCELCGGEGVVSAVAGEVCAVKYRCGEEVTMLGGVLDGVFG
jgi:hypothetical protein